MALTNDKFKSMHWVGDRVRYLAERRVVRPNDRTTERPNDRTTRRGENGATCWGLRT